MLFLKLFIFATFMAGTSYCMTIECYALKETECPQYDIGKEMPQSVEDLQNICTNLIPLGHCILGVMEKCAADEDLIHDTEEDVEEFRNSLEFIESACEEDSRLFKAIADNLLCVTSTLQTMDDICEWRALNETIREQVVSIVDEEERPLCVMDAWIFYCMTARFDVECGTEVKYASSEILDNTDYLSQSCRNGRSKLSYFEEAFKTEFRLGKHGQSAVPGIIEAITRNSD